MRQDMGLRAERGDVHIRAPAPAQRRLDRVPPPRRAIHGRAVSRERIEPRLGGAAAASRRSSAALDETAFRAALEERLQGLLGSVGEIGPRGVFPLSGLAADVAGSNRVALVGEAVHVIPPIGAQGLNLGLRDAACIADCVADALAAGGDIGAPPVLEAYGRMRRADVASRIWSIDLLNRSLLSSAPPVQALRGLGLHILKNVGPVRRRAILEGLKPSFIAPRLMQTAPPRSRAPGLDAGGPVGMPRYAKRAKIPTGR